MVGEERMTTIYKGWNAKIFIGTGDPTTWTEIGCAESASVDITTNIEPYYCIGSKEPAAIVEGNLEITGSISRAWVNTAYLQLLTGSGSLAEFHLCFKAGTTAGAPIIYLYKCRFESGSIDIPQDGVLTEDYDFRATSIVITEEPEGGGGGG